MGVDYLANIKICLDAGHYGKYNRSPAVPEYYESDMNWKLHLMLKARIEEYEGVEVILTREDQEMDKTLFDRGCTSEGCDLFLSIHSNAVDDFVHEDVDYPKSIVQLDGRGDKLGLMLGECVKELMGTKQDVLLFKREHQGGEYYGVLRGAAAVGTMGIILEHSFHTNTKMTKWLLDDNNLAKAAKAEAEVLAKYFGLKKKA